MPCSFPSFIICSISTPMGFREKESPEFALILDKMEALVDKVRNPSLELLVGYNYKLEFYLERQDIKEIDLEILKSETMSMNDLRTGQSGKVVKINTKGLLRQRLMEMGLTPGVKVTHLRRGAFGDPTSYMIRGTMIALRKEEASEIRKRIAP